MPELYHYFLYLKKENMKSPFTTFFFVFIFLTGKAQLKQPGWLSHTDTARHFSFSYPKDWTLKLPGTQTRFFVTTQEENDSDDFRENLNCIVKEAPGFKPGIPATAAALKETLKERMNNFMLIDTAYIKWNNVQALRLSYRFTITENDKEFPVEIMQQMAVLNGILYTFTYTGKPGSFTKFLPLAKKIIQSVQVY